MITCEIHGNVLANKLGDCPACWCQDRGHKSYGNCTDLCRTAFIDTDHDVIPAPIAGPNYEDTDLTSFGEVIVPDMDLALMAMAASDQIVWALANRPEAVSLAGHGFTSETLRYLVHMRTSVLEVALMTEFRFA